MGMTSSIGLYYPYIHFRDEAWLKVSALYWDTMTRIVPSHYRTHDSDTVRHLAEDLGFIHNITPHEEILTVGEKFLQVLTKHATKIQTHYGLASIDTWPNQANDSTAGPRHGNPKLAYIYTSKLFYIFHDFATDLGLVTMDRRDGEWVGMHPRLAMVYMSALAAEIGERRQFAPVTDQDLAHLAVGGYSVERIACALLDKAKLIQKQRTAAEVEEMVANIAIQTVLPKNIAAVPVKNIIKFRQQHMTELAAFKDFLHTELTKREDLLANPDADALRLHLETLHTQRIKPLLRDLEKSLKGVGIDTVTGAMNVEVKLPALLAATQLHSAHPIAAAVGAIACTLLPIVRERRHKNEAALKASPVAYLLQLDQAITPQNLAARLLEQSRNLFPHRHRAARRKLAPT